MSHDNSNTHSYFFLFFSLLFLLLSLDLTPTLLCIGSGHPLPSLVFFYSSISFLFMSYPSFPGSTSTLYAPSTSPASFLVRLTDRASPIPPSPAQLCSVALLSRPLLKTCASRWCTLFLLDRPCLFFSRPKPMDITLTLTQ